jgi:hypothetical protein
LVCIHDIWRDDLIEFVLEHEAFSTRQLVVKYTDEKRYLISESFAYRILNVADLITAPDYVVIKAPNEFMDKTTAINKMLQTEFTFFKIIAWNLSTNMCAHDVTDTIELALTELRCDHAVMCLKPCLLNDNGSCYISGDLDDWLRGQKMTHKRGAQFHPET